jgi:putative oxidoreductase
MKNAQKALTGIFSVIGRVLLCAVFIAALTGHTFPNVHSLANLAAEKGLAAPTWGLVGGVLLVALGSFSIIVGYMPRLGASFLLAFLLLSMFYFHGFGLWTVVNAQARQEHIVQLTVNLSMAGAMLFIIANGSGQMSFDSRGR